MSVQTLTADAIERELARLRDEQPDVAARVRTHIVDLVLYTDDDVLAKELEQAIAGLRHNRPSRVILAHGATGAEDVTADAAVFCSPSYEGAAVICCELVTLVGPPGQDAIPNMVASMLLPDLPVFLLWLAKPAFDRPLFRGLRSLATRLVTDSTRHPETLDALAALVVQEREVVTDLAWTKITGWREIVASMFDDPAAAAVLGDLERVRVRYVRGSDAQARLLAGWLRSRSGAEPVFDLAPVDAEDMRAGSLVRVELDAGGKRFVVDRSHEGVAVVSVPGAPDRRAALRVPPFEKLIGDELEFLAHDHAFQEALASATDAGR
jgi:glucose-6-phosphate dehydrogenase assembly protein OpcA